MALNCVVTIDNIETKKESGKEYVVYIIKIQYEGNQWEIAHRFSEFHDLKATLAQIPPRYNFPDFPNKKAFASTSSSNSVVEQRRRKFSRFLNLIVQQPLYFGTPDVKKFLAFPEPKEEPVVRPLPAFAVKLKEEKQGPPSTDDQIKIAEVNSTELSISPSKTKTTKVLPLVPTTIAVESTPTSPATPKTPTTPATPKTPATPTTPATPKDDTHLLVVKPKEEKELKENKRISYAVIDVNALDDNELKRILLKGEVFLKYAKTGQPHNRYVWVTDDFTEIVWRNPKEDIPADEVKKHFRIEVDSILEVYPGQKTQVFLKSGRAFRTAVCFSIIAKDRTLDLECKTSSERDMWVKAFKLLMAKK